jgi:hypothetical protein
MATSPTDQTPPVNPWEALAAKPQKVTFGLLGTAALFALIPIYLLVKYKLTASWGPVFFWGILLVLVTAATAIVNAAVPVGERLTPSERMRLQILILGGVIGLLTALLGLTLPFTDFAETFKGGIKEWRKHPWDLTWTALALFGGLTLMFVSLLLARGAERSGTAMRRVLLGYNAVLSGVLLAVIIGVGNVLAYTDVGPFNAFNRVFDWTSSGLYSLSDSTKNFLVSLQQPVKVYVLLPRSHPVSRDVETLLENCRSITNKITWTSVSRDLNQKTLEELAEKYQIPDALGMLVTYGPEGNVAYDYIKLNDFYVRQETRPDEPARHVFKGESALLKTLTYLAEGKSKAVVYFTQGHGELDWQDRSLDKADNGMGLLIEDLSRGNYELKPLTFDPKTRKVPENANVVVIARPRNEFSADIVQALRDFLRGANGKKGKLIVLLDVVTRPDGSMVRTGLEGLLREYNVEVGDDRVLDLGLRIPTLLTVEANPRSTNPVARAFLRGNRPTPFLFQDARTVRPGAANPMAGSSFNAETLLQTSQGADVWAEKDLSASPAVLAAELRKPANRERMLKTLSPEPLPLAVAVTEGTSSPPPIPGHPPVAGDSQPRLLVFGDATWISNQMMASQFGPNQSDLFGSCLAWLRERPDVGTSAGGTERKLYKIEINPETNPDAALRLKVLPAALMVLGLVGVAGGVWVVRRR